MLLSANSPNLQHMPSELRTASLACMVSNYTASLGPPSSSPISSGLLTRLLRKKSPRASLTLRDLDLVSTVSTISISGSAAVPVISFSLADCAAARLTLGSDPTASCWSSLKNKPARMLERRRCIDDFLGSLLSIGRKKASLTTAVTVEENGDGDMKVPDRLECQVFDAGYPGLATREDSKGFCC